MSNSVSNSTTTSKKCDSCFTGKCDLTATVTNFKLIESTVYSTCTSACEQELSSTLICLKSNKCTTETLQENWNYLCISHGTTLCKAEQAKNWIQQNVTNSNSYTSTVKEECNDCTRTLMTTEGYTVGYGDNFYKNYIKNIKTSCGKGFSAIKLDTTLVKAIPKAKENKKSILNSIEGMDQLWLNITIITMLVCFLLCSVLYLVKKNKKTTRNSVSVFTKKDDHLVLPSTSHSQRTSISASEVTEYYYQSNK